MIDVRLIERNFSVVFIFIRVLYHKQARLRAGRLPFKSRIGYAATGEREPCSRYRILTGRGAEIP